MSKYYLILSVFVALLTSPLRAGEPVRLTKDGLLKRDPVFVPGKNEIIYTVEVPSGRMKLQRLNLDTGKSEFVHPKDDVSDRELSFSADGGLYVYNVITGGKGIDSIIRATDLKNNRVAQAPGKGWAHWPSLSPDGNRVVFTVQANQMYLWDIDFAADASQEVSGKKGDKKNPPPKPANMKSLGEGLWPRFSPDGKKIVFTSRKDNDLEIYSMDVDGNAQQRLTKSPGIDSKPAYSPDGKRIAYVSNRDGNFEIYVCKTDGSEPRRVTNHPEKDDAPVWHPNGKQLLIVGEREGMYDLYLVESP